jgi:hypothetical protein
LTKVDQGIAVTDILAPWKLARLVNTSLLLIRSFFPGAGMEDNTGTFGEDLLKKLCLYSASAGLPKWFRCS